MVTNSRENRTARNQDSSANDGKITKASSSSRTWSGLKDPRVVRVSHSFKGKDRHSKVYTIKGLRDRRIRLSVPTAIQLYDLQERLGLNQPSKVVDWLLNAARHEIDELPPLQIPPGNFGQYHQMLASQEVDVPKSSTNPFVDENTIYVKYDETHSSLPCKEGLKINNNIDTDYQTTTSTYWDSDALLKAKFREFAGETVVDKNNWIKRNDPEKQEGNEGTSAQASSHSSFQRSSHSLPGFLNNVMPFNPYYHWEPSNLSLCHRGNHGLSTQTEEPQSYNVVSLPSSLPLPPGSQLLVCPSGTTPSFFPPCVASPLESNARQINHFQMLSPSSQNPPPNSLTPPIFSISQPTRPFQLSSMPQKLLHPFSTRASQQEAENTTPSSTLAATFFQFDPKAMHG